MSHRPFLHKWTSLQSNPPLQYTQGNTFDKVDKTWGMEDHKLSSTSGPRQYLILMGLYIPTHVWYLCPFGAIVVDHSCTLTMAFASTEFTYHVGSWKTKRLDMIGDVFA